MFYEKCKSEMENIFTFEIHAIKRFGNFLLKYSLDYDLILVKYTNSEKVLNSKRILTK